MERKNFSDAHVVRVLLATEDKNLALKAAANRLKAVNAEVSSFFMRSLKVECWKGVGRREGGGQ